MHTKTYYYFQNEPFLKSLVMYFEVFACLFCKTLWKHLLFPSCLGHIVLELDLFSYVKSLWNCHQAGNLNPYCAVQYGQFSLLNTWYCFSQNLGENVQIRSNLFFTNSCFALKQLLAWSHTCNILKYII